MVQNSNLLVCYVTRSTGGAARTLKEAQKNEITIRNIADEMREYEARTFDKQNAFLSIGNPN